MKVRFLFAGIPLLFAFLALELAQAEFLHTGPGTYQHTDTRHKVIVSDSGIFFCECESTPLQTFNPAELKEATTRHAFLSYDRAGNRYSKLLLPGREFRITGGFNIRLGQLLVKVDKDNPYVSFMVDDPTLPAVRQGLLGIMGSTVVVNTKGTDVISLVEANGEFQPYRELIKDYVEKGGELYLDGKLFSGQTLGLNLEVPAKKNACLTPEAVILSSGDIARLKALEAQRESGQARELLEKSRAKAIINSMLILRLTQDSVVALDYNDGNIKIIRPLATRRMVKHAICTVEKVEIN